MSDREGGGAFGPFLLGIALGAALGALFAPDTGEATRRQLKRKLRGLRDLAEEKAEDLKTLVARDEDDDEDAAEADDLVAEGDSEPRSTRDVLEERLATARRRRQAARTRDPEEEDEPIA